MALINCPECTREISDSTKKCPHCGYVLKKTNYRKIFTIAGISIAVLLVLGLLFYFLIYQPTQLPIKAAELLEQGNYAAADKLYAKLPRTEENNLLREQLYYESRILCGAKALQDELIEPESLVLVEAVLFDDRHLDENTSTEEQEVYVPNEPEMIFHVRATNRGGNTSDGFVRVWWTDDGYEAGDIYDTLEVADTLPWYIEDDDHAAAQDFWLDQMAIAEISMDLSSRTWIGEYDLTRVNKNLEITYGQPAELIPSGDIVVTPTPRVVTVTPKPTKEP